MFLRRMLCMKYRCSHHLCKLRMQILPTLLYRQYVTICEKRFCQQVCVESRTVSDVSCKLKRTLRKKGHIKHVTSFLVDILQSMYRNVSDLECFKHTQCYQSLHVVVLYEEGNITLCINNAWQIELIQYY